MLLLAAYDSPASEVSPILEIWFEYGFWLLFVIPGVVASLVAKTRRILHGFTAGLLVALLITLFAIAQPELGDTVFSFAVAKSLLIAVSLSTIGAFLVGVWKHQADSVP